jgi:hypothetical protein
VKCYSYLFYICKLDKELKKAGTSFFWTTNRSRKEKKSFPRNLDYSKIYKLDYHELKVYHGKIDKNVLLLNFVYTNVNIAKNEKIQPDNIVFNNSTKFGVDVFYQMARKFSVNSVSRMWRLKVFFIILDIATIRTWIL